MAGKRKPVRTTDRRLKLAPAAYGLLASLALAFALAAYVQSRPNTSGLSATGEFDGNRAFADLGRLASFGPRPPGLRVSECD